MYAYRRYLGSVPARIINIRALGVGLFVKINKSHFWSDTPLNLESRSDGGINRAGSPGGGMVITGKIMWQGGYVITKEFNMICSYIWFYSHMQICEEGVYWEFECIEKFASSKYASKSFSWLFLNDQIKHLLAFLLAYLSFACIFARIFESGDTLMTRTTKTTKTTKTTRTTRTTIITTSTSLPISGW